jgi:carbohydrate kinase (thermoresistant glucokinase family)
MIALVMGTTGAGKTTVGKLLAEKLGWIFLDADDFHPAANVAKMKQGIPLDNADRAP